MKVLIYKESKGTNWETQNVRDLKFDFLSPAATDNISFFFFFLLWMSLSCPEDKD